MENQMGFILLRFHQILKVQLIQERKKRKKEKKEKRNLSKKRRHDTKAQLIQRLIIFQ
jgi:hypothetical protein